MFRFHSRKELKRCDKQNRTVGFEQELGDDPGILGKAQWNPKLAA